MASLQNIVAEAQTTQSGVTTKGLGENSYGVKATLNAKLPEGLKANVKFSDKTISSLINNFSTTPEGASIEVTKGDVAKLTYNLQRSAATLRVNHKQAVSGRDLALSAEWRQENGDIDLEASHEPDKNTKVTLIYSVNGGEVTGKGSYKMDASRVEGSVKLNARSWNVKLTHELSKQDKLEAELKSENSSTPTLRYTRQQDGVELALSAPVSSDIRADAKLSIKRTFEL